MKIWKGKEREGPEKDIMTLFVKDYEIDGDLILNLLKKNPDCKRLYLGAGRTDVKEFYSTTDREDAKYYIHLLIKYCKKHDIKLILEVSLDGYRSIHDLLLESMDRIILRIQGTDLIYLGYQDCIKIDNESTVFVAPLENMIETNLNDLKNDMFSGDIIIFNDEED